MNTQTPTTTQEPEAPQIGANLPPVSSDVEGTVQAVESTGATQQGAEVAELQAPPEEPQEPATLLEASDVLELLAQNSGPKVDEYELQFKGQSYKIFVQALGYSNTVKTDAKKWRRLSNGQQVLDQEQYAITGFAHHIYNCVVKNIASGEFEKDGSPAAPVWVPLYSLEQLIGEKGLMSSNDPDAKALLEQLLEAVWTTNPLLSPVNGVQN